ncbi:beta-galactosidase trimerization domain-containing protein [Pendulispora brunnea]|uniref:Beta-galactosidase trimerization domain-containing protein n=1 Tax=Pendulispora brunnea TaxID=2905690 RepID=A0ABZ2KCT0_9BACT
MSPPRRPLRRPRSRVPSPIWLPGDSPAPPALARRDFLRLGAAAFAVGLTPGFTACLPTGTPYGGIEPDGPTKEPPEQWLRDARTAGFEVAVDAKPWELREQLDVLAASGVNVVEADSDLSAYLTDSQFDEQLAVLDLVAYGCHLRGMRCVAYYPTLEVLSAEAATAEHVMSKEHPDWMQISIDGKPNMFVGGGGRVFWVDPGVESAWMCPASGYVDYFLGRVKRLVSSRLDGLWGDVPLLSDIEGNWPCTNAACRDKFLKDTGMTLPAEVNWESPEFRRWVIWRHQLIWEFEQRILQAIKATKPAAECIIETVTMDYNGGTIQGLDGAHAKPGDLVRVWEVDAVSDGQAMRGATADDWNCMAVMMRHGTGASFGRPSWIFSYGYNEDDAERVMALAIATRNNPYETKIPLMCTTVGNGFRQRMYDWMTRQQDLYILPGANHAAVLFSSASRDFLDRNSGVGLYASLNSVDSLWWSSEEQDSSLTTQYLADYRGTCKALLHAHVPFDVVPVAGVTAAALAGYKLLAIPSAVSLSNDVLQAIQAFVTQGGTVLVTGNDGGTYDENGTVRSQPALGSTLGLPAGEASWVTNASGKGKVVYVSSRAGRDYFQSTNPALLTQFANVAAAANAQVATTGPKELLLDLRRAPDGIVLVCANMFGLGATSGVNGGGPYSEQNSTFRVSIPDEGKVPTKVLFSEPTERAVDRELPFEHKDGVVSFDIAMHALGLVRVSLS